MIRLSYLSTFLLVLIADRLSKNWVLTAFEAGESRAVWPDVLHWTRVNNTGAAFGILKQQPLALAGIGALFLMVLMYYYRKHRGRLSYRSALPWILIAAGACGNLADRLVYGYVIDFIDFRVWPVFNIADSSICMGAALLILSSFTPNARCRPHGD